MFPQIDLDRVGSQGNVAPGRTSNAGILNVSCIGFYSVGITYR
jgi:hypothetical protein